MDRILKVFQYVSYLKLPLAFAAIFLVYQPQFTDDSDAFDDNLPIAFILIGFAFSVSSFRDMKKTDRLSQFLMDRPRLFHWFIGITMALALAFASWGGYLMFDAARFSLGVGFASFGIGYLALIKSVIDQAKDLTDHY